MVGICLLIPHMCKQIAKRNLKERERLSHRGFRGGALCIGSPRLDVIVQPVTNKQASTHANNEGKGNFKRDVLKRVMQSEAIGRPSLAVIQACRAHRGDCTSPADSGGYVNSCRAI